MVMILDLNMWKNQFFYVPKNYGQYTGKLKILLIYKEDNKYLREEWVYVSLSAFRTEFQVHLGFLAQTILDAFLQNK